MKTRKLWWSAATAAAVFAATWLGATPGRAQTGDFPLPEATPIPLDAPSAPVAPARAQAVQAAVIWTPNGSFLRPDSSRNVTVTASSGDGLDFDYARITFYSGSESSPSPVLAMSATIVSTSTVSGIDTMTLTAALPTTPSFSMFAFSVKEAGSTVPSGKYKAGFPVFMPGMTETFEWPPTNLDGTEPANDNQCSVGAGLTAEKTYNGTFKSTNDSDWSYIDVGSTVNMQITATNVPTPSQLQVFVAADGKCTGIPGTPNATVADKANPSVTLSGLSGGRVYMRMVAATVSTSGQRYSLRVAPNPTTGSFEENDTPCQATPALADTTYTSYADDNYDFFELNVPTTGTLSMTLGLDVVAQLDLRSPLTDANCSATTSTRALAQKFIVNNQAQIQYFLAPGKYYARVYVASGNLPNPARAYTLRWALAAGSKPAKVCIGKDASIDDCGGDVPNNLLNVKWQGLNGNARIRLEFTGNGGSPNPVPNKCVPGSRPMLEFTTTDIEGARTSDSISNGGYSVKITVTDVSSGATLYTNEQSLKVGGCNFRPADAQALPEFAP
jgi:hypothetical protein